MSRTIHIRAPNDLRKAAEAVVARYSTAPSHATETALAVLALWALDAVEADRLTPQEANSIFVLLDIGIGDRPGPELSDQVQQRVLEGEHFHHHGEEWGPDADQLRALAFAILLRVGE